MFIVVSHCLIHHETGGTIVVFTEISFSESHKPMQDLFLKFRAPHKRTDETCYLAKSYPELRTEISNWKPIAGPDCLITLCTSS